MKIAYILITNGLEYDDRIRKEMFSMRELLDEVEFKVFAFHGDNRSEKGTLSYGVPYEIVSLRRRGGRKGFLSQLRKEYDFYSQIKPKVRDYDLLWVCDHHPFFFPLLSNKPIIWDLHEIPSSLIGTPFKNMLFQRMERRCKFLIHANHERLLYLTQLGAIKQKDTNLVLRNFPDRSWLSESHKKSSKFIEFQNWICGDEYVYIQGITSTGRFPWETLSAIMEVKRLKAVVVGYVPTDIIDNLKLKYPDVPNRIFYTGQLVQSETASFIANSMFSIVFYSSDRPNNRLCEPNRMFQCLALGKPVIVGKNEPMRNIIEHYNNGIVLDSFGENIPEIINGINLMINNYQTLKANAINSQNVFLWEKQLTIIKTLFK